jgi:hypothetical protein
MLSESTRKELQAKMEHLRRTLDALDHILAGEVETGRALLNASRSADIAARSNGGALAGLGLREAARVVLKEFPRGLKPNLLAIQMEQHGFKSETDAKTPLVTRVRNELWRMAKKGELRNQRGTYSLPTREA